MSSVLGYQSGSPYQFITGFNQFENEADVGYWTGILGMCCIVRLRTSLNYGRSVNVLPHAILDFSPLGEQLSLWHHTRVVSHGYRNRQLWLLSMASVSLLRFLYWAPLSHA